MRTKLENFEFEFVYLSFSIGTRKDLTPKKFYSTMLTDNKHLFQTVSILDGVAHRRELNEYMSMQSSVSGSDKLQVTITLINHKNVSPTSTKIDDVGKSQWSQF